MPFLNQKQKNGCNLGGTQVEKLKHSILAKKVDIWQYAHLQ